MTVAVSTTPAAPPRCTPPRVTERDVLHRAADLLEEFGWVQHDCGSKESGFCLVGALWTAAGELGVSQHQSMLYIHRAGLNTSWNDEPGRTKAEVVAKLREAAEAASG